MIHVTIFCNEDEVCVGFQAEGHAGYAELGDDIVCAAASVLIINTINSIEVFTDDEVSLESDEESGMITYRLLDEPSRGATLLLESMILGLQDMVDEKDYADYIDLTFEEV